MAEPVPSPAHDSPAHDSPAHDGKRLGVNAPATTVLISLAVCLLCSLAVTASTSVLRPIQRENERELRKQRVLEVLSRQPDIEKLVGDLATVDLAQVVIDLSTGERAEDVEAASFDAKERAVDPDTGVTIPPAQDVARLKRRARHAVVTVIRREGRVSAVVLPLSGRGYGGVIEAALAVGADGNTLLGLIIQRHEETPGIGDGIEDEEWRAQWRGKKLRDDSGEVVFRVVAEDASNKPPAPHRVDGVSGATVSSEGMDAAVRYWAGDHGFGPLLRRLQEGTFR